MSAKSPRRTLTRTKALIAATLMTLGGLVWLAQATQPLSTDAVAEQTRSPSK